MKIGDKVSVRTGTIEKITDYPELNLTYYAIRMKEHWASSKTDLIYVEKKQLEKIMKNDSDDFSDHHLIQMKGNRDA